MSLQTLRWVLPATVLILPLGAMSQAPRRPEVDLVPRMAELSPALSRLRSFRGAPPLGEAALRRVDAGGTARVEIPVEGSPLPRVALARILDAPVESIYLVLADVEAQPAWVPGVSAAVRIDQEAGGRVQHSYQLIDVPWPGLDRGWVSRWVPNTALYEATGGACWELQTSLMAEQMPAWSWAHLRDDAPRREMLAAVPDEDLEATRPLRAFEGAWVLVPLGPNRTYVEYDFFIDPGLEPAEGSITWAFGAGVMMGMYEQLAPLVRAYTLKRRRPPPGLLDMRGAPAERLLDALPL